MSENYDQDSFTNFKQDRYFLHYQSPLSTRYASTEMSYNFSEHNKIATWRKLWLYLAKGQQVLGVRITLEQLKEIKDNIYNINFTACKDEEKIIRNEVMAHLRVLSSICPKAAPILNLGASGAYITNNSDLILLRDGFKILIPKLARCVEMLCIMAEKYKDLVTLSYVHYLPTLPTTLGKRIAIWGEDLVTSLQMIEKAKKDLKFRGVKDINGTQASVIRIFSGDKEKVKKLDQYVAEYAGFNDLYPLCTQTYPRIVDYDCVYPLARLACVICKICNDIRLLSNRKELEEGTRKEGTRGIPYRSERCCSLARHMFALLLNPLHTAANQWLERSLDDSANRILVLSESFLTSDVLVETMQGLIKNLVVNEKVIETSLRNELPFLVSNALVSAMVASGKNRDEAYKNVKSLNWEVAERAKAEGIEGNYASNLLKEEFFAPIHKDIPEIFEPKKYIGMSSEQVATWVSETRKFLEDYETLSTTSDFFLEQPNPYNFEKLEVIESPKIAV